MRKSYALVLGLLIASPAMADPIWDKVEFGMTRDQTAALYPAGGKVQYHGAKSIEISDVKIMGKCDAEANIFFGANGTVDRIVINGNPSMGGRCSDTVLTGLASKYGEPLSRETTGASILAREGKIFVWNRPGGVTMRFKKFGSGALGGGGMFKASWELTYTNVGGDISL